MKIEVTLPDARFCTKECPAFLTDDCGYTERCWLGYWDEESCVETRAGGDAVVRPQKCNEEHGE